MAFAPVAQQPQQAPAAGAPSVLAQQKAAAKDTTLGKLSQGKVMASQLAGQHPHHVMLTPGGTYGQGANLAAISVDPSIDSRQAHQDTNRVIAMGQQDAQGRHPLHYGDPHAGSTNPAQATGQTMSHDGYTRLGKTAGVHEQTHPHGT